MEVYNYLLVFLFIMCFFSFNHRRSQVVIYLISTILICIASLKSPTVGSDSLNYYYAFSSPRTYVLESYFSGLQKSWYYANIFLNSIVNYDVFLAICYSISIAGIGYLIYKESQNYAFSFLLYFLLYFYCSSLNIMRQYIAIGIVCVGLCWLRQDNKVNFIYSIVIGFVFHYSTLLLLPFMYINKIRINIKSFYIYFLSVISFVIGFGFNSMLSPVIANLGTFFSIVGRDNSAYVDSWGGERNILTNLIVNIAFIVSYYLAKNKDNFYLFLWFVFIVFNNIFGAFGDGNRFFLYFQIAGMIISIPDVLYEQRKKIHKYCYLIFILTYSFGVWFVSTSNNLSEVIPYKFR